VPEDGGLIGQALIGLKPVNAWVHTYTKSQTPSTRSRGLGWRIHESVEDTKLSTNKQHTLSLYILRFGDAPLFPMVEPHPTPCLSAFLFYKARILGSSSRQSYVTTFRMGMSM